MELSQQELDALERRRERSVLQYLEQLPDDPLKLHERQMKAQQDRDKAQADAVKFQRIRARCTTRVAVQRNARRAGNSLLRVRMLDEELEAIRRKLRSI